MIEVQNLTKRYNNFLAVDNMSFTAKTGEIVGLLGPNGAGKTTTMRMLTGFMPPSEGIAKIAGFDVTEDSMEVRKRVGYLPERVPIYPDMTVKGYITFWAKLRGIRNPNQRVQHVLETVNLSDRRNTLVRNLSKGMRQRLGLAQALVHEPEVVILDEPTIGIDPQQVIEVRESVRQLGKKHTVLFSTHILSEAEQVCDRVIIINKGHIVAQGAPATLRKQIQKGDHLYAQVGGANAATAGKLLSAIPGIEGISPQGAGFTIRVKAGKDVRGEVAQKVVEGGYQLLELRPVAMTLEEMFLDVVGKE
ncbi:MAG: ATP-binding cassette domain-containing protein [Anaerolineaceae bacterium]|nr:ATP-binding cassette domain-containing protein [Anaerolineaceae bacterium]